MYVCICNNVTERDIENAVKGGARTLACLENRLAVSTNCGQCRHVAAECLQSALGKSAMSPVTARPRELVRPLLELAC